MDYAKRTVTDLLALADIEINGSQPFDIQVHDKRFYQRVLRQRELGLGESYMDGWWDVQQLDGFIARLLSANLRQKITFSPTLAWAFIRAVTANQQNFHRAGRNASYHYNIGNDLYKRMLGKRMIYSCAYWKDAKTLDEAQEAKLDLICRKLHLKKGMTLLDIGCGWGGFAEYAASKYGAIVTGITPAAEQVKFAKERTKGLPVTILRQDYREVTGSFDRLVSIGMLEHVGPRNYRTFFQKCHELLKDDGLTLHHMIGRNKSVRTTDPWIDRYIFPGGVIPTLTQLSRATERLLIIEDVHNFGPYYDRTLMAWYHNFVKHYGEIRDHYDERFYRMWTYYLQICAGGFRSRELQLYQIAMRKIRPSDVYQAAR